MINANLVTKLQSTKYLIQVWQPLLKQNIRPYHVPVSYDLGYPCGSAGKEPACSAGDLGSISGLGRSLGERNGYPLPYSGLGLKESDMTEQNFFLSSDLLINK